MKKLLSFFACLLVVLSVVPFGSRASASALPLIVDYAGVLTESQEAALSQKAENVSDKYSLDVVVMIIDTYRSAGYSEIADYADDFFDQNGYGYGQSQDGLMLLISLNERETYISTQGKAIDAFTDYGINAIFEDIIPYMKNSDWNGAAAKFISCCDDYMHQYGTGTAYDVYNERKTFFFPGLALADCGIGLALSGLPLKRRKKEMQTVNPKTDADDYKLKNSFHLSGRNDYFINKTMSRTPIPRDTGRSSGFGGGGGGSSIHISSSGHTHGGGGSHF